MCRDISNIMSVICFFFYLLEFFSNTESIVVSIFDYTADYHSREVFTVGSWALFGSELPSVVIRQVYQTQTRPRVALPV